MRSDENRTLEVLLKKLTDGEDLPLPAYASEHAACVDLSAAVSEPVTIEPGEIALIPTGIAIAIPVGFEAQVRPRSGLATYHGITLPNSPATIDADFRGEIVVPLINLKREPFTITRGMRIAQMLLSSVPRIRWSEVAALPETERGGGGFGHSGL
jgi:dUTP pyrophosphatase